MKFHGVDIDSDYVVTCKENIQKHELAGQITVEHESIYDHYAPKGKLYDVAYFGASFMLMPDPVKCLKHVKTQVNPDATIYFTQTFQMTQELKFTCSFYQKIAVVNNAFPSCTNKLGFAYLPTVKKF